MWYIHHRYPVFAALSLIVLILGACQAVGSGDERADRRPAETNAAPAEAAAADTKPETDNDNLLLSAEDAQPIAIERASDVPELPFADNADPSLCGIPQPWGSDKPAYLSGFYEGELIRPIVFLYDSHLRRKIQGQAPHGAEVKILLSQSNPTLDYFMVKLVGSDEAAEGWVPAPFVSFEPPPAVDEG